MATPTTARSFLSQYNGLLILLAIGAGAWLLWRLRDLLILLFLTLIIVLALRPIVDWLTGQGINRRVASFGVIILLLAALIGLVYAAVPQLAQEGSSFTSNVPQYVSEFSERTKVDLPSLSGAIEQAAGTGLQTVFNVTTATFGILFSIFAVVTIGYYGLAEYDEVWKRVKRLPGLTAAKAGAVQRNIERRLGGWVRGQAALSVLVGIIEFITYLIFGIPFAGLLAILGAVFAIIPVLGPIAAAVPLLLVALTISVEKAIGVGIAYLAIQLVAAYLFTPKILGKAAGLHPVSVIVALIAGSALGGVVGILLAIPVLVFLLAVYEGLTGRHASLSDV